jgi:pyruvate,water dikinase
VPPGFIVTTVSYFNFLEEAGLREEMGNILEPLNPDDSEQLLQISTKIKDAITSAEMPQDIADEIREAYQKLGGLVAVRSSATAEDLPDASFAGQQRTFLNIQGEDNVVVAVQECWASLFEPRAIFYRNEHGIDHMQVGIAVPVQRMVQSEAAGVLFTMEPVTNESKITIEAVYGLGEVVVSGEMTPDHYLVDKERFTILEKRIVEQDWQLVKSSESDSGVDGANVKLPVSDELRKEQKLSDDEIISLAKLGAKIEDHYQFPQDIEWAKEGGELYVVQTRPITTLKSISGESVGEMLDVPALVSGSSASPGLGSGPVQIVSDPSRISEVKEGDILVAEMTTPDYVPAMKRAAGIATDRGGRTCHAAIVSRELGVPCVVGTGNATNVLKPDQVVTVDGSQGKVYEGRVAAQATVPSTTAPKSAVKTRTKLYVNLAEPDLAETVAARDVDGVGLIRAEFMVAEIGEHPRHMLK